MCRITRLANHILQQRSFYPLFPPAEGCQLSVAHSGTLSLEQTPDVLLLPSQLNPFSKKIGDVLCINPGKLTKGNGAGTFARLAVHPVVRRLRSGPGSGSRKVAAGSEDSPLAEEEAPGKAQEEGTCAAAAAVSPQQLSQNFDSAAVEGAKEQEAQSSEGDGSAGGSAAEPRAPAEAAEGNSEEPAPQASDSDVMQVDAAASANDDTGAPPPSADESSNAKAAGDTKLAVAAAGSATDAVPHEREHELVSPLSADAKAEVAHRVCERTRVEIVRI